jgi:hypothetical protein
MGTEIMAYRYGTNTVADEKNTAAVWALSYVWWMTFFERHPHTDPIKYPNTSRETVAKQADAAFRDYKRSLEWAARYERRGL